MNEYNHYFTEALNCSNQSGKSPLVEEYEKALSTFFNVSNVVAVNSGSAAIQTALQTLGATQGKRVIVSATAPLPTLIPISATGAKITFVDCLPNSPNINPESLEAALGSDVVAVVEVPLWGYLHDYSDIVTILEKHRIPLIEDAAHSHGSTINGKYSGTFGTIGCYSTHQKKLLSTGEGGFIVTESAEIANSMRKFSRIGNLDGKTFGMNFKVSAFTAAVGLARLSNFPTVLANRRKSRTELLNLLKSSGLKELFHIGEPNGYNLVFDTAGFPKQNFDIAIAETGIELDTLKYGYKCGYKHQLFLDTALKCSNAESLISRLIQLPTDTDDNEIISEKVLKAING